MPANQRIEALNPLRIIGEEQYTAIWQKLFITLLAGFWGRFMFVAFVALAVFFGIRRRNPRAAAICAIFAAIIAYGSGIARLLHVI